MRILIIGAGAIGGMIAARLTAGGIPISLATRSLESAAALRRSGISVRGIGGEAHGMATKVATLAGFKKQRFDVILLATKAQDALATAATALRLLSPKGVLVPLQNGGVAQMLSSRFGHDRIVGGLSNLGVTLIAPGVCEQRNDGHLLIGEMEAGMSARVRKIAETLRRAVKVRTTANLHGAIWSKLLLNCSVTTLGALAGQTMEDYITTDCGRLIFRKAYDETLNVALALGHKPERMIVDPFPPDWKGASVPGPAYDEWIAEIISAYGKLKPSMLQDFERGRRTEIEFINGYVAQMGETKSVPVPWNSAITRMARAIEDRKISPGAARLEAIIQELRVTGSMAPYSANRVIA